MCRISMSSEISSGRDDSTSSIKSSLFLGSLLPTVIRRHLEGSCSSEIASIGTGFELGSQWSTSILCLTSAVGFPGNTRLTSDWVISEIQTIRSALLRPSLSLLRSILLIIPGLRSPMGTPSMTLGSRWNMSCTVTTTGTFELLGTRWACSWSVMWSKSASDGFEPDDTADACRILFRILPTAEEGAACSIVPVISHPSTRESRRVPTNA